MKKILIANRGEIACRIARTAHDLGIATVAVYSDADARALHVALADEAVHIGPAPAAESYLRADAILNAARATGADAIHPGYGFLSENPAFVEQVEAAGLTFIGPSAEAIRAMGLKDRAKALMEDAGVPVVPGFHGAEQSPDVLAREAERIGYPVLIKARAGGGGKGMRLVKDPSVFEQALESARREAESSFGDPACLVEKFIANPRHIEVQVFGDSHGNVVHLFERDCSLQRRHQKVIEEAPAPGMTEEMRAAMGAAAVRAAKAVNYSGAGTVEFIVDGSGPLRPDGFWFMEMNTRLQVEHPVTEAVTGLDLVALQIEVAEGKPLPFDQADLAIRGHAFEARLYAEDASRDFLPVTGQLSKLTFPDGAGIRIDAGVRDGDHVTPHYDPMIAKIIVHASERGPALRLLQRTLRDTVVAGMVTNRQFLMRLASDPDFAKGDVDTGLIETKQDGLTQPADREALDDALAMLAIRSPEHFSPFEDYRHFGPARQTTEFEGIGEVRREAKNGVQQFVTPKGTVEIGGVCPTGAGISFVVDGQRHSASLFADGDDVAVQRDGHAQHYKLSSHGAKDGEATGDAVLAPMPGNVRAVRVSKGDAVEKGQVLLVLEAMKMELSLHAPRDGLVADVLARMGDQVEQGALLVALEETDE